MKIHLYVFEKILFSLLVGLVISGFWYFEENIFLKILALFLGLISLYLIFKKEEEKPHFASRLQFPALLVLYYGFFDLYNFLYSVNLPLYMVMIIILLLVSGLFFVVVTIDKTSGLISRDVLPAYVVAIGLVILEVFLTLYFWPIAPEVKSFIIIIIFYLILALIYLHIHNMLRLKRILGYLVASFVVLAIVLVLSWFYGTSNISYQPHRVKKV